MPRVTISEAALVKLDADPKLGHWKRDPRPDRVPMLHYYLRLYSTAHDGTITEHGDGFTLIFVDPDEARQPHVAGYERVPLGDGHDVVVEIQTPTRPASRSAWRGAATPTSRNADRHDLFAEEGGAKRRMMGRVTPVHSITR